MLHMLHIICCVCVPQCYINMDDTLVKKVTKRGHTIKTEMNSYEKAALNIFCSMDRDIQDTSASAHRHSSLQLTAKRWS